MSLGLVTSIKRTKVQALANLQDCWVVQRKSCLLNFMEL